MFPGVFPTPTPAPQPPYPGGSFQPTERQAAVGRLALQPSWKRAVWKLLPRGREVGRPGRRGGSPRARGPAGKGRLVLHPLNQPVSVCAVPPPPRPPASFLLLSWESPPFPTYLCLCTGLRVSSILLFQNLRLSSLNSPHAIGWAEGGRVLLRGATATPQQATS